MSYKHRIFGSFAAWNVEEKRVIGKKLSSPSAPSGNDSRQERRDLLEDRVSRGRTPKNLAEADELLKSDAQHCVDNLGKTKVGWLTWFNNFCSTEAALKSGIRARSSDYADKMIKETGLYVGPLAGNIFFRGKRKLMLVRRAQLEKEFVDDMQRYYLGQEESLKQDEGLYSRLENAFRKQQVTVKIGSPKQRQNILNAIGSLQAEFEAEKQQQESASAETLETFRNQAESEAHIKKVLVRLGVVDSSTQLSSMLKSNALNGDLALYTLVKNHPALRSEEYAEVREELLSSIDELRRRGSWWTLGAYKGDSGWYRAFTEGKQRPVNDDELFQRLQEEPFDRIIRVAVPGLGSRNLEVEKKDNRSGIYYLFDPATKNPMILSPDNRELTYRDKTKRVRHFSFEENPNSIALLN